MARRPVVDDDAFTVLDWDDVPDRLDMLRQVIRADPAVLARTGTVFEHPLLSHAIWVDDPAAVALILELGADPNFSPEHHDPPVIMALRTSRDWRASALPLLAAGADLERTGLEGTALHTAVATGDAERVRFVLDRGGRVDTPAGDDETPLWRAANRGDLAICRLLLAAGADPSLADSWYQATPAEIARQSERARGQPELIALLDAAGRRRPARRAANRRDR